MVLLYKTIEKISLNEKHYWFTFFTDVALAISLMSYGILIKDSIVIIATFSLLLGILLFTLLEYIMHRWFFHRTSSIAYLEHDKHHNGPTLLIATPFFVTLLIGIIFWLGIRILTGNTIAAFFVSGLAIGHMIYGAIHHSQHHSQAKTKIFRKLQAHHNIHHKMPHVNYGVTNTFWDHIFRTHIKYHKKPLSSHK